MYEYQARLISLTDADTMRVEIVLVSRHEDLGFGFTREVREWAREKLRLYGVQAPERYTAEGKAAIAFVVGWIKEHCPDEFFTVNTFKTSATNADDKQEKYGRYLAIVTAPDGYRLNDDLVTSGNAVPYMIA